MCMFVENIMTAGHVQTARMCKRVMVCTGHRQIQPGNIRTRLENQAYSEYYKITGVGRLTLSQSSLYSIGGNFDY